MKVRTHLHNVPRKLRGYTLQCRFATLRAAPRVWVLSVTAVFCGDQQRTEAQLTLDSIVNFGPASASVTAKLVKYIGRQYATEHPSYRRALARSRSVQESMLGRAAAMVLVHELNET